ncbi:phage holin family protein [Comamonadaceae bacterium OH2545_COT-014]|nr:phage holin family protein [Comamonadaceae bacterium OH2545_COT-014]
MSLLITWLLSALALMAVAYMLPGVRITNFKNALLAAVILGLINAVLRPVLLVLTFPITVLTLGLFVLVLNGLLFWLASSLIRGFQVSGFWSGVFGALLYSLINWGLNSWRVAG